ncbi:ACT domain-containing protein [Lysobacter sp. BMK333-48F3]|uniref:ACT domain-containing protein n=1 Tax=Lysobacter sp. BMK333-48F3 TaxID=2867962 RepID=UPI002108101D|nr:ACT domain-containing protein [Lysobacter sp. BMK333-48F3]
MTAAGPLAAAETDLAKMLATLQVDARDGEYVFVSAPHWDALPRELAQATIVEAEGPTCVLRREHADARGLDYDFVAAWLSLRVHSALQAVGLTAAVAQALAARGIACNVLAGYHHDHLLVPAARREDALAALLALRGDGGATPA